MDTQTVLRKLQALLARGNEESNDNEHERAIALRQAQKLMDQYNISLAEVEAGASHDANRGESSEQTGSSLWKASAYNVIAKLYGVKVYRKGVGRRSVVVFIGAEHNRNACILMAQYVITSIERESKKYKGTGHAYIHAFKSGAVNGVLGQVKAILAERAKGETLSATGNALVLVDYYKTEMQLNEKYLANQNIRLGTRGAKSRVTSSNGYYQGRDYGSSISLNNQVAGRNGVRQLTN